MTDKKNTEINREITDEDIRKMQSDLFKIDLNKIALLTQAMEYELALLEDNGKELKAQQIEMVNGFETTEKEVK